MVMTGAPEGKRGRRPTHRIWHVEGAGEDARWTEVCALWPTKNGHGLTGGVDSFLPAPDGRLQGRIAVLPAKYKAASSTDVAPDAGEAEHA